MRNGQCTSLRSSVCMLDQTQTSTSDIANAGLDLSSTPANSAPIHHINTPSVGSPLMLYIWLISMMLAPNIATEKSMAASANARCPRAISQPAKPYPAQIVASKSKSRPRRGISSQCAATNEIAANPKSTLARMPSADGRLKSRPLFATSARIAARPSSLTQPLCCQRSRSRISRFL